MCVCRCWKDPTTKDAFRLSIASMIITLLAIWMGLWLYVKSGSPLCLVYCLENVVDFLSDGVVFWRFYAPSTLDEAQEQTLGHREERASLAISIIMIVLGFLVMLASFIDLLNGADTVEQKAAIFAFSFLSMLFLGPLTLLKLRYGKILKSPSMRKDGIVSLIGFVLAVSLFVDTIIEANNDSLWWLDPVAAFIAGGVATYLGVQALQQAQRMGIPVFDKQWWNSGGDDATTSAPGTEMTSTKRNGTSTGTNGEIPVEPLDEDDKELV